MSSVVQVLGVTTQAGTCVISRCIWRGADTARHRTAAPWGTRRHQARGLARRRPGTTTADEPADRPATVGRHPLSTSSTSSHTRNYSRCLSWGETQGERRSNTWASWGELRLIWTFLSPFLVIIFVKKIIVARNQIFVTKIQHIRFWSAGAAPQTLVGGALGQEVNTPCPPLNIFSHKRFRRLDLGASLACYSSPISFCLNWSDWLIICAQSQTNTYM